MVKSDTFYSTRTAIEFANRHGYKVINLTPYDYELKGGRLKPNMFLLVYEDKED